ncbi:MAG: hypothetical protein DRJ42_27085, partial [Deltaproteobacteria bacterium]
MRTGSLARGREGRKGRAISSLSRNAPGTYLIERRENVIGLRCRGGGFGGLSHRGCHLRFDVHRVEVDIEGDPVSRIRPLGVELRPFFLLSLTLTPGVRYVTMVRAFFDLTR